MKKLLGVSISLIFLIACGSSNSGRAIAEDVCKCSSKFEELSLTDPKRTEQANSCMEIQKKAWDKVKDDKKKLQQYSERLNECAAEQSKKNSGK